MNFRTVSTARINCFIKLYY